MKKVKDATTPEPSPSSTHNQAVRKMLSIKTGLRSGADTEEIHFVSTEGNGCTYP